MRRYTGMTLIETLLAITIIVMILGTVYAYYSFSMQLTARSREKLEDTQMARVILHRIASELKGITSSGSGFTTVVSGDPDRISFVTTAVPSRLVFFPQSIMDSGRIIEHDIRNISYYLTRSEDLDDEVLGLGRDELRCLLSPIVENQDLKDLTTEEIERAEWDHEKFRVDLGFNSNRAMADQPILQQSLISDKIKFLRFDYFDGVEWTNTWHRAGSDAIPRAIYVTIGFEEMDEELSDSERLLPIDQRPWYDDQYSVLVSLILSDDLKAQYSGLEEMDMN